MWKLVAFALLTLATRTVGIAEQPFFRAGASAIDISPRELPAIRNGGFLEATSNRVDEPLFARSLVLADGNETIVISIVDSCMLPIDVCDAIKSEVTRRIGIPANRILIAATHTHSAPCTMDLCLGARRDANYTPLVIVKVADGIVAAHGKLRDAKAGHIAVDAHQFTNCRRWILRSDRMGTDPFGDRTIRAMMHPGYQNPNYVGPAGPIDPQLSLLSFVAAADNAPICVLANFSMHYFGAGGGFSPDYFGDVSKLLEKSVGDDKPMVGIMSQGTSGDLHWMDYSQLGRKDFNRDKYSSGVAEVAARAWKQIQHKSDITLAMAEKRISISRRTPSAERLAWAQSLNEKRGDRRPKDRSEVYAEQAKWIHENSQADVVLQAVRIGDVGITAIPNEVYGITGLKLKAQSPLPKTFNLELANGAAGYIPPPEQHALGGYTTWPARTAGLDRYAEPKIVGSLLSLLEQVTGQKRLPLLIRDGTYARTIIAAKPVAYWRCEDMSGRLALDRLAAHHAFVEDGIAFHLPGVRREGGGVATPPETDSPFTGRAVNRAMHFAGGRLRAGNIGIGKSYSASMWFWNGLPHDAKPVTAYLFSRGTDGDNQALGEHLGIGGSHSDTTAGVLFFYTGNDVGKVVAGRTVLALRDWHQVTLVRDDRQLSVYLDGKVEIETEIDWTIDASDPSRHVFVGGRCDSLFGLEGKMDEVAVFDRPLTAEEVGEHFRASQRVAPKPRVPDPDSQPLSTSESLKGIHVPDGFQIELVASEPLIKDPVAFDWDPSGRLWVVEMADYPMGMDGKGKAGGRVRVLDDTDNDGRYDTATLYADGLNFPNGILTWRGGAIVTAAPDILFLQDTDGDGKADQREVLFTGLQQGNQQLRANGLRWGLDNWVHVASGGHHGKYGLQTKLRSSRAKIDVTIGARDFRIRPDTGEIQPQSGPTQFGRNRDDWGHWFGTQNSHPIWHYVLPDHYLKRNPHYVASEVRHQLFPANPRVYPASSLQKRYHSFQQANRFTSACSGMIYRGRRLFDDDITHAFACEPFQNLVQHSTLKPHGVTFEAKRVGKEDETDFFASEDRWCRPVMARNGPDGALWIADMYRYMIEHPQWLPDEGKAELLPHYRLGDDRGRIYRVIPNGRNSNGSNPGDEAGNSKRLSELDTAGLVSSLQSANGWTRDKAHQILLWNDDRSAIPALEKLVAESKIPVGRLHALCILDGFDALTPGIVALGISDDHPGVRENAIRVAETQSFDSVAVHLKKLSSDPSASVRKQLALSLGEWTHAEAGQSLADLLNAHGDDPWIAAAAFSSSLPHLSVLSKRLADANIDNHSILVQQLLQIALGAKNRQAVAALLDSSLQLHAEQPTDSQFRLLTVFLDVLASNDTTVKQLMSGPKGNDSPDQLSRLLHSLDQVFQLASQHDADADEDSSLLIARAAFLTRSADHRDAGISLLQNQVAAATSQPQFQQSLDALRGSGDSRVPEILFESWSIWSPGFRSHAIDVLLSRESWTVALIEETKAQRISTADFDPTRRMQLMQHGSDPIKKMAGSLFGKSSNRPSRAKRVQQYHSVLQMAGNADNGFAIYKKVCSACHRHGDLGHLVGPDLKSVVEHSPEKLLTNILDPNLDIQPGYRAYGCLLQSGELLFGLIASENATGIVFKLTDGRARTVLRKDIEALKSTGVSLMPENLESTMTKQDLADVIAFLRRRN